MAKRFNAEDYRQPWESDEHWELRKEFLVAYASKFSEDRLLCLAQAFVNVELLGCSYPAPVMRQIAELAKEIENVQTLQQKRQERAQVKFVKEGHKSGKSKRNAQEDFMSSRKPSKLPKQETTTLGLGKDMHQANDAKGPVVDQATFRRADAKSFFLRDDVMSSTQGQNTTTPLPCRNDREQRNAAQLDSNTEKLDAGRKEENCSRVDDGTCKALEEKFCKLCTMINAEFMAISNSIQLVHLCTSKLHMKIRQTCQDDSGSKVETNFETCVYIDEVFVSRGSGRNKKASRLQAFNSVVAILKGPHLRVVSEGDKPNDLKLIACEDQERILQSGPTVIPQKQKAEITKTGLLPQKNPSEHFQLSSLKEIVLVDDREVNQTANAIGVLMNSAQFNHATVAFDYSPDVAAAGLTRCTVTLDTVKVGTAARESRQLARLDAAIDSIDRLQRICFTVKVKQYVADDDNYISKQEIEGSKIRTELSECISENNVGYKMLQMMGWKGGGVGKEGNTGMMEPIRPQDVYKREGLGFLGNHDSGQEFRNRIQEMLVKFVSSDDMADLVFSSEFSKEQRLIIHRIADKLHLKSISRGKGDSRFLTISRRFNPQQLVEHLIKLGGSTPKYELVYPTE